MIDLKALSTVQFWVFLQVLVRVSSLVAVAPVFAARQMPGQVKIAISLVLALTLTPIVRPSFPPAGVPTQLYELVAAVCAQAFIGLLMGFVVALILEAFQIAGALLDLQTGFTMAQTFNPNLGELAAPLTQFQNFYALLLFLLANGHHVLILALARSFAMLPASALDFTGGEPLKLISDLTFGALVNGLKIATPVAAVLLVIDISFALLNRAMPQLNIFYVGMPVKVIAGLIVLGVILPATAVFTGQLVVGEPRMLADLLHAAAHRS